MVINQFISPVGPDFSIPYYSADSFNNQHSPEPALYGEDQFKNGFGPVYATPTYPGTHNHTQNESSSHRTQQDIHPALFDQNQFKNGYGPVYATPTTPWNPTSQSQNAGHYSGQQTHKQNFGGGQWQQNCGCSQRMRTYYMYPYCVYPTFRQQNHQ